MVLLSHRLLACHYRKRQQQQVWTCSTTTTATSRQLLHLNPPCFLVRVYLPNQGQNCFVLGCDPGNKPTQIKVQLLALNPMTWTSSVAEFCSADAHPFVWQLSKLHLLIKTTWYVWEFWGKLELGLSSSQCETCWCLHCYFLYRKHIYRSYWPLPESILIL